MTFERHVMVQGPAALGGGAYRLSGIQSAAWHDRGPEGEHVRAEIRAAAAKRGGVPIYDVGGQLLETASDAPSARVGSR